jgi:hypothetical protein
MNRTIEQMLIDDLAFGVVRESIVKLKDSELKEWLLERLLIMEEEHAQDNRG